MNTLPLISFTKQKFFALSVNLFSVAVMMFVLSYHVTPTYSQMEIRETHRDCEMYCHMNCDDIPDGEPHHKEKCKEVHSHESECHCHFGGVSFGIFVGLGVTAALLLACCLCRFCRRRGERATKIVVVTQPQTITTITHHQQQHGFGHNRQGKHQQQIYSIETVPQSDHNAGTSASEKVPPHTIEDQNNNNSSSNNIQQEIPMGAVTIITNSRRNGGNTQNVHRDDLGSSSPTISDRVFFVNPEGTKEEADNDLVFKTGRY